MQIKVSKIPNPRTLIVGGGTEHGGGEGGALLGTASHTVCGSDHRPFSHVTVGNAVGPNGLMIESKARRSPGLHDDNVVVTQPLGGFCAPLVRRAN